MAALLLAGASVSARGQATTQETQPAVIAPPAVTEVTEQSVQAAIEQTRQDETLKPETRDAILDAYSRALEQVKKAQEWSARAAGYDQAAQDAPAEIRRLQALATQPTSQFEPDVSAQTSLEEMESQLKQRQRDLEDLKKQSDRLADELKSRAERMEQLPGLIAQAKDNLKQTREKLAAPPTADEPATLRQARQAALQARRQCLDQEILALEKELAGGETVRGPLLRARQDALARQIDELSSTVSAWQKAVDQRREEQARRQLELARQAEREAAGKHELVQRLLRRNTELAELRTGPAGLNERRKQVAEQLRSVNGRLAELDKSSERIRTLIDQVGLTDAIGLVLRQERDALPSARQLRRQTARRRDEVSRVRMTLFQLTELAGEVAQVDPRARQLVQPVRAGLSDRQAEDVLASVRKALQDRKDLVGPLIEEHEQYFTSLIELDAAERRLADRVEAFARYIDERILWVRNAPMLGVSEFARLWAALRWLGDGGAWGAAARALAADAAGNVFLYALLAAAVVAVLAFRPRITAGLSHGVDAAAGSLAVAFGRLIWAMALATLLGSVAPGLLGFVGWRLTQAAGAADFAFAVGRGLIGAAVVWWPLAVLQQIGREKGIGETRFRWPGQAVRPACRLLRQLTAMGLPMVFLVAATQTREAEAHRNSLGRAAAIVGLIAMSVYAVRLLRPSGRLMQEAVARRKDSWILALRPVWYPLAVVMPLALAGMAAAGYYYATVELARRMLMQWGLVLGLIVLNGMLMRWVGIARRRLALRAMAEQHQAERQAPIDLTGPPASRGERPRIDLSAVSTQTMQFVRYLIAILAVASLLVVWADVLPALGLVRRVEVWSTGVNGQAVPVTLSDLLLAAAAIVLTVVLSRNIGGVLEITLLQRMRMEAGGRYAVNALVRYAVWVTGVIVAFHLLGVTWSHVQWLVAAMTVGLAFGLQEIFGNFVSGLIILFERPIRVGDVVTVGEITGTVSRIRIRATTITDWDRRELIVPNKQFITGQLVNWSLSDKINRAVIPVGIAYGSDTDRAIKLLLEVAAENKRVLAEPAPQALFLKFGDSSLEFELRVFVGSPADFLAVRHELNMAIDQAFRRAGIEIAFPQRDIRIRSIDAPVPVRTVPPPPPAQP